MKHAYLIIAHTEFKLLENLISILDYPYNDIFVHIDKKVEYTIQYKPRHSKLIVVSDENRCNVVWGEDSQIHCELVLYRLAYETEKYDYFHLLSGIDMPLKSQEFIHTFFEQHKGIEFIGLMPNAWRTETKLMYYHFFISRPSPKTWKYFIHTGLIALQRTLHLKRNRMGWKILAKGANWSSLTNEAVGYILSQETMIRKRFKYTMACDEVYKQTILMNSPFAEKLYNKTDEYEGCQRLVDWKRGNPYTWTIADWNELINSNKLFARKFSSEHWDVVEKLTQYIKKK